MRPSAVWLFTAPSPSRLEPEREHAVLELVDRLLRIDHRNPPLPRQADRCSVEKSSACHLVGRPHRGAPVVDVGCSSTESATRYTIEKSMPSSSRRE